MKACGFEARVLERQEYGLWDELVARSPQGTVFHKSDYLQIVSEASSADLNLFGCFKNDELVGGCPLLIKKFCRIFSRAASSGPLTPFGGFILPNLNSAKVRQSEGIQNGILDALCDSITGEKYHLINITNSPDLLDVRPFLWRGWEGHVAYTYYIDLNDNFSNRFSNDIKKNIRKASNSGFHFERFSDGVVHYNLLKKVFNRQNQQTPVDQHFFTSMLELFERKNCGSMWVARDKSGDVIASHIRIWDDKRAYAWSGASDPAFRDSGANQFLFDSVLKELQRNGLHGINIMHGNTQRLSLYAAGYNPTLVPYYKIKRNWHHCDIDSNLRRYLMLLNSSHNR